MTSLIIIRGNSGSGKTSLAKSLQAELSSPCLLLQQDVIRRDMLRELGHSGRRTPDLVELMATYGHKQGLTVILEGFYEADRYGSMLARLKETFAPRVLAYYYDLPFEETVKRHATRSKATEFSPADMKRWWLDKDYLAWKEEKQLTKELSLQDACRLILEDLSSLDQHD